VATLGLQDEILTLASLLGKNKESGFQEIQERIKVFKKAVHVNVIFIRFEQVVVAQVSLSFF